MSKCISSRLRIGSQAVEKTIEPPYLWSLPEWMMESPKVMLHGKIRNDDS